MFTGIITEIGTVTQARRMGGGIHFSIAAPGSAEELHVNDSISVNGVCLTIVQCGNRNFEVEAVEETLEKTTLGQLRPESPVNLELPVRMADRLGGHLVLGHVDCTGTVRDLVEQANSRLLTVEFPEEFARYVIPVGSVAMDGVSLTVARLQGSSFTVSLIPHTLEKTTIAGAGPGTRVNLEFDVLGKYVERLLASTGKGPTGTISTEKLREWGYDI